TVRLEQPAESIGPRSPRITPFGRVQSQPAGGRELDDRGAARIDEAVASLAWIAQRPIDCRRPILTAIRVDPRLDGPIAPVRDGNLDHLGVRKDFTDASP